jgi:hypothetical protein
MPRSALLPRRLLLALCTLAAAVLPARASAQLSLLHVRGGFSNGEYGTLDAQAWTARLRADFGPANIATADLAGNSLASLSGYDRLIISLAPAAARLTAQQAAALQAFAAAGKRAVLVGDGIFWDGWSASLLAPFGGAVADPGSTTCSFNPAPFAQTTAPLVGGTLTAGVSAVSPPCTGGIVGGTAVFDFAFASLFGPQQNVLVIRDSDIFRDARGGLADNARFVQNTADWLAATPTTTAPEPATVALLGAGLLAVGAVARRRRA